ncbi:MAG: DUF3000 family protein [Microbacteriaceae bacterium]|nr:DUF3000 family protein [Microbacteriaceae bacterium]
MREPGRRGVAPVRAGQPAAHPDHGLAGLDEVDPSRHAPPVLRDDLADPEVAAVVVEPQPEAPLAGGLDVALDADRPAPVGEAVHVEDAARPLRTARPPDDLPGVRVRHGGEAPGRRQTGDAERGGDRRPDPHRDSLRRRASVRPARSNRSLVFVTDPFVTDHRWVAALASLDGAQPRAELRLQEVPSPEGLAPHSRAFAGDIHPPDHGIDSELGTGRFIVLHDAEQPEAWAGEFRVVCYAQAPLEHDIGSDPMLAEVAWSWLVDALEERGAPYHAASGTATTVLSTGFGGLADQGSGAQIEVRASWSPDGPELGRHLEAWGDFLCLLAGLPPSTDGVTSLAHHRSARGR